jgi:hypothetical protein
MSDKSGEAKQKAEGKPITDKDLEDISGGIVVHREPIRTVVPTPPPLWHRSRLLRRGGARFRTASRSERVFT